MSAKYHPRPTEGADVFSVASFDLALRLELEHQDRSANTSREHANAPHTVCLLRPRRAAMRLPRCFQPRWRCCGERTTGASAQTA